MFIITSTYIFMLFLIFWSYCGYLILLFLFSTLNPKEDKEKLVVKKLSKLAILVPCYNEESYVRQKIDNLKKIVYEQDKIKIYFLNGTSTDNTSKEIASGITDMSNWNLIETNCKGKINQLNCGLSRINPDVDIIVVTDMDAMLMPDVFTKIANEFNSDEKVSVVGANISPQNCIPIEENYWRVQNYLRLLESAVYTSSIVVAPCYAFKTDVVKEFPEDCVADDVYVAFKGNTDGHITRYIETANGSEIRTPATFSDFFRHKYRKGNAYLRELLRFLYRLPQMEGWWKIMYLTKILQFIIVPWVLPYFLLSTISLALNGWGFFKMALFGFILLFISFLITSIMMSKVRSTYSDDNKSPKRPSLKLFIISNLILVLVGLSYPFYKQTSNYRKIGV